MINQLNYNTMLWNLAETLNIDSNKSSLLFYNSYPLMDLYLNNSHSNCPYCNSKNIYIKGSKTSLIKHSMSTGSPCFIRFHMRIFKCLICLKEHRESINIMKSNRNISQALEMRIIELLMDSRYTFKNVSEINNVSLSTVVRTFDKYVEVKRGALPNILSIDEIYSRRLTKTKYCCILYNPIDDKIVDVINSRRMTTLDEYFYHISLKERKMVKYFVSDLNETYRSVHNKFFKDSICAVDSFHVVKNLSDLFNKLRIRIMSKYEDLRVYSNSEYWLLKKFYKLLFLYPEEIEDKEYNFKKFDMILNKTSLIEYMLKCDKELKEAYYLMMEYKNFNKYYKYEDAKEKLEELIDEFTCSSSDEMKRFGYLLINWKKEILNSFIKVNGFRLSNGRLERANRYIKLMFSNAYGFTNFPRTRNRIMFTYNKDFKLLGYKRKFSITRIKK